MTPEPVPALRLAALTDPQAVNAAVAEFRALGRTEFLARHQLEMSRDYFLWHEGELIDSKPILSIAFGYQHPEHGPLDVSRFSGGAGSGAAVAALTRLGFRTATRAQVTPPRLGEEHASRTAVQDSYGGDSMAGIMRFPGDNVVNIFSDAQGPYADDPPSLAAPFGYRGEGLNGPQKLTQRGNTFLENARLSQEPARFWYRPKGKSSPYSFMTWVAVIGRTWRIGEGQDKLVRAEIEWFLEAVPSNDPTTWPETVTAAITEAGISLDAEPTGAEAKPEATYADLVARVKSRGQRKRSTGTLVVDYVRSAAARRAVLLRSGGRCESLRCTGMPADKKRGGAAILEVDHVQDLALGGEDDPRNMAALCPNCHACKTYGQNAAQWRRELARIAIDAHTRAITATQGSSI